MPNAYTHGHHESVLRSHRSRTAETSAAYLLGALDAKNHLLDVGCGPGTITVDLASRVRRVTALEHTEEALQLCRDLATERGCENVGFAVGDVHELPFEDEVFDVVHAHQVLQHVGDPVRALSEMWRVTRPGGWVAARDSDYAGFLWHPADPRLTDWLALYQRLARSNGGEPDAGRRLLDWALQAGLENVTPSASMWCFATPAERQGWGEMWSDRALHSRFAEQALADGAASQEDLQQIADAWREWSREPAGWFGVPHGEILARKPG